MSSASAGAESPETQVGVVSGVATNATTQTAVSRPTATSRLQATQLRRIGIGW